jgi:hypothetical protein
MRLVLALAFGIVSISTAEYVTSKCFEGIGVIAGDCFEGLAWDTFMRLAFGIVLFVVTVDFVASRGIESYDDTHFYEWNLEISALVL